MAPGLGLLSAHQRRYPRSRRHDRGLHNGERPFVCDPGLTSRAVVRSSSSWVFRRGDRPRCAGPPPTQGGSNHRQRRKHLAAPRPDRARLEGQPLRPRPASSAVRVLRRRCVAIARRLLQGLGSSMPACCAASRRSSHACATCLCACPIRRHPTRGQSSRTKSSSRADPFPRQSKLITVIPFRLDGGERSVRRRGWHVGTWFSPWPKTTVCRAAACLWTCTSRPSLFTFLQGLRRKSRAPARRHLRKRGRDQLTLPCFVAAQRTHRF